jgi:PST family polysaccharide transporter
MARFNRNVMTSDIRKLFHSRILSNVIALYGVQGCTYLLPVITFPYLARVLHPDGWGAVLFAQAIGAIVAIVVEYGFDFSATRETARFEEDKGRLRELIAGVLGAKMLLALIGIGGALLARPYTTRVAPEPALFWASTLWGVGQGINMLWYFQGLQRMRWAGALDIGGKVIATIGIFAVVRTPADGWKVMAAQALGCGVSHAVTVAIAYREVGFCWPRPRLVWQALCLGWPMFLFRASLSLSTSANGLILGFFGSRAAVGFYVGADKLRQVAAQALWPITQALFPHQAQQVQAHPEQSVKTVHRSLVFLGGASILFSLVLFFGAPLLVRIALGAAFTSAVPVLRVLAILVPLTTFGSVIVFQWMLPLGMDRQFNYVVLTTGVVNMGAGIVLASKYGATGMAVAALIGQICGLMVLEWLLRRAHLSLFSKREYTSRQAANAFVQPELVVQD